ncbi:hypothetical protein [Streptomyces virginiae]
MAVAAGPVSTAAVVKASAVNRRGRCFMLGTPSRGGRRPEATERLREQNLLRDERDLPYEDF